MRNRGRRRLVELGKSILLLVLAISAVFLIGRTQLYDDSAPRSGPKWVVSLLHFLTGEREIAVEEPSGISGQALSVHPVRMMVVSQRGWCGIQYDNSKIEDAAVWNNTIMNLFSDALAGAGVPVLSTAHQWEEALSRKTSGIYLDFLGEIPLDVLSAALSGGRPNATLKGLVRRVFLTTAGTQGVVLYYINEMDGMYYACEEQLSTELRERLIAATDVSAYDPTTTIFAFRGQEGQYKELSPYTMVTPDQPPRPMVYRAGNPVPLEDTNALYALMQELSFHPQSNPPYSTQDGQGIREGGDNLRINSFGVVTYKASETDAPRYVISSASGEEGLPTRAEMVAAAWQLADKSVGTRCGAARLYLGSVSEVDDMTEIYFAYQLNGATVRVGQDGYAAKVVFQNGVITEFWLQLRTYEDTGAVSIVLPELQAAGAMHALGVTGGELMLHYLDQRGSTVTAEWVAK